MHCCISSVLYMSWLKHPILIFRTLNLCFNNLLNTLIKRSKIIDVVLFAPCGGRGGEKSHFILKVSLAAFGFLQIFYQYCTNIFRNIIFAALYSLFSFNHTFTLLVLSFTLLNTFYFIHYVIHVIKLQKYTI